MSSSLHPYQKFMTKNSSLPLRIGVISVFVGFVIFLVVAWFFEVNRTVMSEGEVVAVQGEKEVFAKIDGHLQEVDLQAGRRVKAGQTIAQMKVPLTEYSLVVKSLHELKNFMDKQSAETNELNPWPKLQSENPTIMAALTSASQAWEKYLATHRESDILITKRLQLLRVRQAREVEKLRVLKKSSQSKLMTALQDEVTEQIEKIQEEILSNEESTRAKKTLAFAEAKAQLRSSYLVIYDYLEQHIIRSPADGILAKVNIASFQQLQKGQSLLTVIPEPSSFAVKLRIPALRISRVELNSTARISVESYPYQKFGYFEGKVFSLDRIVTPKESFYEVKATVFPPPVKADRVPAADLTLLPGMRVKAYILIKRQPLLQMIYERMFLDESW